MVGSIHKADLCVAGSLPNGYVMLEKGEKLPEDSMLGKLRNSSDDWRVITRYTRDQSYEPAKHIHLAKRIASAPVEW